ncbi:MAG TPA: cupredoxin domain-containing protein [Candidatus Megaira endosymbiont of Nemacystus decipiens]|nr:cupredoxin domain-containing protein [Candidatus Megaera endosymbiont of Nemacystus decipiens]
MPRITFAILLPIILFFIENVQASCDIAKNLSILDSKESIVTFDIHIKNHEFSPSNIELPSGKKIRITIYNDDPTIEEFESFDLKREKIIIGKSKTIIVLAPLKPGIYKFFGEFHEETAQGKIVAREIN